MANKTIHELSPATTVGSGYEFAIYDTDNNTTKKATVSDILSTQDLLYADDDATPTGEVDFSSQDTSLSPSSSVSVDLLSGDDSWSARFVKISQMFKNIRFLFGKIGTTDISSIGGGTVTGAISALNSNLLSGTFNLIDGTDSDKNLNTIYSNQVEGTIAFISGQNEQNQATTAGRIHLIISFKRTATYGIQYEFQGNFVYSRALNAGEWSSWYVVNAS